MAKKKNKKVDKNLEKVVALQQQKKSLDTVGEEILPDSDIVNEDVNETPVNENETEVQDSVVAETKKAKPEVKEQPEKDKDKGKAKKKKEKKPNKIAKALKETGSELKKVSWPTFGKVVKQTGVVLVVVIFFALVLLGIDQLLSFLFGLIMP